MEVIHPLRAYRESKTPPMTVEALATFLGYSTAAVSRWETGRREPRRRTCVDISEKLGIPLSELMEFHREAAE